MTGSYTVVTKTLYTTVWPDSSFTVNLSVATSAIKTTSAIISSSIATSTTAPALSSESSTAISSTAISSTAISSSSSSSTPTPSVFAASPANSNEVNNSFAIATLVVVAVLGLLLLVLLGYMIFLHFAGDCGDCNDKSIQLARWERGEMKPLSRISTATRIDHGLGRDLEKGTPAQPKLYASAFANPAGGVDMTSKPRDLWARIDQCLALEALRKPFRRTRANTNNTTTTTTTTTTNMLEISPRDRDSLQPGTPKPWPGTSVAASNHSDSIYSTLPPIRPFSDMTYTYPTENPYGLSAARRASTGTDASAMRHASVGTDVTVLPRASVLEQAYDPVERVDEEVDGGVGGERGARRLV
jgi:hypothetical protein